MDVNYVWWINLIDKVSGGSLFETVRKKQVSLLSKQTKSWSSSDSIIHVMLEERCRLLRRRCSKSMSVCVAMRSMSSLSRSWPRSNSRSRPSGWRRTELERWGFPVGAARDHSYKSYIHSTIHPSIHPYTYVQTYIYTYIKKNCKDVCDVLSLKTSLCCWIVD